MKHRIPGWSAGSPARQSRPKRQAKRARLPALHTFLGLCVVASGFFLSASSAVFGDTGADVVVIYNTQMPGSKQVAEHYARRRGVPTNQVWGLELSTAEAITR